MASYNDNFECILLDLDGTLVDSPKNKFLFINTVTLFKRFVVLFGILKTISIIKASIKAMLENQSNISNYSIMLQTCQHLSGKPKNSIVSILDQYYLVDFLKWEKLFTPVPGAAEFIKQARAKGKKIYIWTNPIWPEFNVKKRLHWGGYDIQDFSGFTHSQNIAGCKPNLNYFVNALQLFELDPKKCLYIGDSEFKDGPARTLGIETVILSSSKKQDWELLTRRLN